MKKIFMILVTLTTLINISHAASAKARIIYQTKKSKLPIDMRIKDSNSVTGSIRDLEELEQMFMCYDGGTDDVCDVLKVAVKEENLKQNNKGSHELNFKCKTDDFGGIEVKIKSDAGEKIKINKLLMCK